MARKLNEIPNSDIRIFGPLTLKRLLVTAVFLIIGIFIGMFLNTYLKLISYLLFIIIGIIVSRDSKQNSKKQTIFTVINSLILKDNKYYYPQSEPFKTNKKGKEIKHCKTSDMLLIKSENNTYPLIDNKLIDLLQIETCDLKHLNANSTENKISELTEFNRSYHDDYTIINNKYKPNYERQIRYLELCMKNAKNDGQKKAILNKMNELKHLEKNTFNKEYYLIIYGSDVEDLDYKKEKVKSSFRNTKINEISLNKKNEVINEILEFN